MQITGVLYGAQLLRHVDFPSSEVLGPDATEDGIQRLIERHGLVFVKPLFKGEVVKKGKSGLIGKPTDLKSTPLNTGMATPPPRPTALPSEAGCRLSTRSTSRSF